MEPSARISPKVWRTGLSFLELLVILVVVAILVGLLFPCFSCGLRETGKKVAAHNDEIQIVSAVKAYYAEYGRYPVDPLRSSDTVVFSTDNNLLIDVLRNCDGAKSGNSLNPRNIVFLDVPLVKNQDQPRSGIQTSTGIWFDPWGSPYRIAIDASGSGELNGKVPIPRFYSDVGPIKAGVIAWSYGKNGGLGGGPAVTSAYSNESGTPGKYAGSGDVVSW